MIGLAATGLEGRSKIGTIHLTRSRMRIRQQTLSRELLRTLSKLAREMIQRASESI